MYAFSGRVASAWIIIRVKSLCQEWYNNITNGGRQIDYNAYIKRLETIDMEYEKLRFNVSKSFYVDEYGNLSY